MAAVVAPQEGMLIAVMADEDTITGFLLAGVGNIDLRKKRNFLVVDSKMPVRTIEASFKEFAAREDIAVILMSQQVANQIRHIVDAHRKPIPSVLEIPSKDCPYDPAQDGLLTRVKHIFGAA